MASASDLASTLRVLQGQAEADLSAFEARCRAWPLVRECHMLNGEVDFILKCVAPDLLTFLRTRVVYAVQHGRRLSVH
jgi:DNA-binding Lrp family transcriptional regulator